MFCRIRTTSFKSRQLKGHRVLCFFLALVISQGCSRYRQTPALSLGVEEVNQIASVWLEVTGHGLPRPVPDTDPLPPKLCPTSPLCPVGFSDGIPSETIAQEFNIKKIYLDRVSYGSSEHTAQAWVSLGNSVDQVEGRALSIHLSGPLSTHSIQVPFPSVRTSPNSPLIAHRKFKLQLDLARLPVGAYTLHIQEKFPPRYASMGSAFDDRTNFTKEPSKGNKAVFPAKGIAVLVHSVANPFTGTFPISTGIPFPEGVLTDVSQLQLTENGTVIAAQFDTRATWRPAVPTSPVDIKWLGLTFQARYIRGVPLSYRLILGHKEQATVVPSSQLNISETSRSITIKTGPGKFVIRKDQFAGISEAWVDQTGKGVFEKSNQIIQSTSNLVV